MADAQAVATTGQVVLHDVSLPFEPTGLTLSQLRIDSVEVPSLSISQECRQAR